MTVIGFNFNKISVERTGSKKGKLNISNNVGISDVSEEKVPFSNDKNKCIKVVFKFESKYEPSVATINLEGEIMYMLPPEKIDAIMAEWKKDKKIPKDFIQPVMNAILSRSNVEALVLSKEMNLPSPIPLPKVNVNEGTKEASQ
ncbi:MAG: hypothetical protein ACQER9_00150 [Nanobdellota archaeon]